MDDLSLFRYRGLSAAQLDEMIYAQKLQGYDGIIEDNVRLRQTIQEARQAALDALATGRTWRMADRMEVLTDGLEAIVNRCEERLKR